jgi:hypothetical protein
MVYYKRKSNSGHSIEWLPENEDAAAQAIVEVSGTGINEKSTAKEKHVELDKETAQLVGRRYDKIIEESKQSN